MKAVMLDGYTTNPGDLSWAELEKLCDLKIYDRTPAELIYERCEGAEIVLTNKTPLRGKTLEKLPDIKYIGLLSTGFNVVDIDYCEEKSIPVCNIPSYSTNAVAQLVFAYILEFCNQVSLHSNAVHSLEWTHSKDFSFWKTDLTELDGKTLGIIGLGKIGKRVADIALAFGMNVIAYTSHPSEYKSVEFAALDELLARSDFVSIHTPLTPKTEKLVNREFLEKMKKTAFLINTSRGPAVDEEALADALSSGKIAGAGLDVLSTEPPLPGNPLVGCKNCFITPHIAWASFECRERLIDILTQNLKAFLDGKTQNCVWQK
ncbi:MAG: D-2-hydroxyacid dehydrogenase [Clostridia bacterium]|nr:D-2-hydroxyacid dehydrogenase [Clostridia bacterium]